MRGYTEHLNSYMQGQFNKPGVKTLKELDEEIFQLVLNDPDLLREMKKYDINEDKLRKMHSFLVNVWAGQFRGGAYVASASIATLPTLAYLGRKLSQNSDLLMENDKYSITKEPKAKDSWQEIAYNLIKYYDSGSMGQIIE